MNNMYALVWFLVVITATSSISCASSNDSGDQQISMIVDDQMTMHDVGVQMSKINPVQIGTFRLEDGKELKLSRKASPGRNCIYLDQPCGALDWCCDGLYCTGYAYGKCQASYCHRTGIPCFGAPCCSGLCIENFCVG